MKPRGRYRGPGVGTSRFSRWSVRINRSIDSLYLSYGWVSAAYQGQEGMVYRPKKKITMFTLKDGNDTKEFYGAMDQQKLFQYVRSISDRMRKREVLPVTCDFIV